MKFKKMIFKSNYYNLFIIIIKNNLLKMSTNKIVKVTYSFDDCFKVPSNIDLENEKQVDHWYVKWNILHIVLTNGKMLKIESEGWLKELDLKNPSEDPVIESIECTSLDDKDFVEADLNNVDLKDDRK